MTETEARDKLEEFRVLIDAVDRRIVELLNERTRVVEDIGRVKRQAQLPIYEPKREDQVFDNVTRSNGGPLTAEAMRAMRSGRRGPAALECAIDVWGAAVTPRPSSSAGRQSA